MEKIAIIGSGIAGMTSAWFLKDYYDITVFEKASYAGGHTNTILVEEQGRNIPIDTGFMVYNDHTYPNLLKFFEILNIPEIETNMSFGIANHSTGFTLSSNGFKGFFAKKSNILNPNYWKLIFQIRRFFISAKDFINDTASRELSLGEFMTQHAFDRLLGPNFIYPMASAIWSTHNVNIEDYPAKSLFRFMQNHGLLGFSEQFTWKTIRGGSRVYRDQVINALGDKVILNANITGIRETDQGTSIRFEDATEQNFDYVIIATHADQALQLLASPNEQQAQLLSPFQYNQNQAILHTDTSVMPKYRDAWSSWNYHCTRTTSGELQASTHYWMNRLQDLQANQQYFVSIDYKGHIKPEHVKWSALYTHPCFNQATLEAQEQLPVLNTAGRIKFCGSYFRNGFHEDAHVSALNVVKILKQMKGLDHEILPV